MPWNDHTDDVAELFHESSRIAPHAAGLSPERLPAIEPGVVLERHRLPRTAPGEGVELEQAIARRVSTRAFDAGTVLPQELLARLLAFSCGFTHPTHLRGVPRLEFRRATPSAGATYPLDVYAVVRQVSGLGPGVYHYAVNDHSLGLVRAGSFHHDLAYCSLRQQFIADSSVVFAITGAYGRIRARYPERGYRYMLFEAGHVAQNLCLLSTAHRLGAVVVGGFVDAVVDRLLGLRPGAHATLSLVAVGVPREEARREPG
jgi:SagB-type dehydrogenase family enzyme